MRTISPEKAVKLTILEHCRMRGVFNSERDIQITFGKHADGVKVRFDRFSLEQFARLALELPFSFADEMLLSASICALGHSMRELAYDRHDVDSWDSQDETASTEEQG